MKKILSVLLSLVLCLGMLPVTASAAADANPTLDVSKGRIFLSTNLDGKKKYAQVYSDDVASTAWTEYTGKVTLTGSSGTSYASIQVSRGSHDIVLRDVNLVASRNDDSGFSGLNISNEVHVNLTLVGSSVIQGSSIYTSPKLSRPGIQIDALGSLTIEGSGTLRAVGGNTLTTQSGSADAGINVTKGSLTIQNGRRSRRWAGTKA